MIIGHIGVAFAARARERGVPLGVLMAASFAPDLVRAAMLLGGVGRADANLYSHALPWSFLLSVVLAVASWVTWRSAHAAVAVALLAVSHIALDFVSGRKQLWLGGPSGLDLGELQQYEFVLESALLIVGWQRLRRVEGNRWFARRRVLGLVLGLEAAYLFWAFTQRPYAVRCFEHPWRPCWIRRGEQAPPHRKV
jgi:hypothetical protein